MPRASARGTQADGQVRRVTQQARGCGLVGPPFSCTPTPATTRTCRCQTGRLVAASHAYDDGNQMKGEGKAPGCRICLDMVPGWSCGQHVTGDGRALASPCVVWGQRSDGLKRTSSHGVPRASLCKLCSAYSTVADCSGVPWMTSAVVSGRSAAAHRYLDA